jgi:hypothetical protein
MILQIQKNIDLVVVADAKAAVKVAAKVAAKVVKVAYAADAKYKYLIKIIYYYKQF